MSIQIGQHDALVLAGIAMHATADSDFVALWARLDETAQQLFADDEAAQLQLVGAGYDYQDDGSFTYFAGFVWQNDGAPPTGLQRLTIPSGEYAEVAAVGAVPQSILAAFEFARETLFDSGEYEHAGTPDLEIYGAGDLCAADYRMSVRIPVRRAG